MHRLVAAALVVVSWMGATGQLSARDGQIAEPACFRPMDGHAAGLLRDALDRSPTVRQLAHSIQRSDLIVYLKTDAASIRWRGLFRLLCATPRMRATQIIIRLPGSHDSLLAVLAHELQHAVELAQSAETRALEMHGEFLARLKADRTGSTYETAEAIRVERRVLEELRQPQARR